jgi:hypothetical protein
MRNAVRLALNLLHRVGGGRRCALLLAVAAVLCSGTVWPACAQVTETTLHIFGEGKKGKEGAGAPAPLLADTTGPGGALRALYGSTAFGGPFNGGSTFKLSPPRGGSDCLERIRTMGLHGW